MVPSHAHYSRISAASSLRRSGLGKYGRFPAPPDSRPPIQQGIRAVAAAHGTGETKRLMGAFVAKRNSKT